MSQPMAAVSSIHADPSGLIDVNFVQRVGSIPIVAGGIEKFE